MKQFRVRFPFLIATATALCAASGAFAAPYFASATVGSRSASANFSFDGSDLVVVLTNTSSADAMEPIDILTGVFFDIAGNPTLHVDSAVLNAGSSVLFGTTDPGNVVGGEWAYKGGLAGAPHGAKYGISSAGLGLFDASDLFPGSDLQGPPSGSPDGLQYGITTAGDNPGTGNSQVTGDHALIKNSVVFRLKDAPANFDPSSAISNVSFQYGTGLDEPNIPEPTSVGMLLVGALLAIKRR